MQVNLNQANVKQVQVKTANKQIRSLRQSKKDGRGYGGLKDEDNDEITFEIVLSDIIASTLANNMGKNDPEYKNFKESFDQVINFFRDRFDFIADELILDVFSEISNRADEIQQVILKNMVEFCDMTEFFTYALRNTNPQVTASSSTDPEDAEERNVFKEIVDCFAKIGNLILNQDPQQTEVYFLEFCLQDLLTIMCENDFKRVHMSIIPYCLCQNTANSHMRVLRRIRQLIGFRCKDQFVAIINDLLELDEEEDGQYLWGSAEMYDFYFHVAKSSLHLSSPVSRTKAISILSQLAPCSIKPIFDLLPTIKKMVGSGFWELQG
jgi:hypothetical protein